MQASKAARTARDDDHVAWYSATTGPPQASKYWQVRRDARGFPIFVKARGIAAEAYRSDLVDDDGAEEGDHSLADNKTASLEGPVHNETACNDEEKHETIADLYARLLQQGSSSDQSLSRPSATVPSASGERRRASLKSSAKRSRPSDGWFINRALREADVVTSHHATEDIVSAQVPVQCNVCKAILSPPVTVSLLEAHQGSIGHQLAADQGVERPQAPIKSPQKGATKEPLLPQSSTVLQSFNVGYVALERMGWKSGMALGREEQRASSEKDHEAPSAVNEQGSDATSLPDPSMSDAAFNSKRNMLEPIPLLKRPDRRGIGIALPASARVRDRPRPAREAEGEHEAKRHTREDPVRSTSTCRLTPQQRQQRERLELKALRQSLN